MYASEGRDGRVIAHLRDVARAQPGVLLAASFVDAPYHRSSYTLVSRSADAVRDISATAWRSACEESIGWQLPLNAQYEVAAAAAVAGTLAAGAACCCG